MRIKFLHLNMMFEAYYIDKIIEFIQRYEFDVINLQEVAGGSISNGNDRYQYLQDHLPSYQSFFAKRFGILNEPDGYLANVTFFKPSLQVEEKQIIWLHEDEDPPHDWETYSKENPEKLPQNAIHLRFQKGNAALDVINSHLTWGPRPDDQPYKLEQAKILFNYVKENVKRPFILSGDFNLTSDSQVVTWFDALGVNLSKENNLTNTLNPRIHKSPHLFPLGLAVDYVYVSHDILVSSFRLIDDEDLSDHLGIMMEVEI